MSLTAETIGHDRPLLPKHVAERWGCSERHVRNLIRDGELKHFRLGGRLLRVPASAVEEYERCRTQITSSEGSATDGSSHGGKTENGSDSALKRALAKRQSEPRLISS